MNPISLLLAIASLAALGVAYGPLLIDFGEDLWLKPHYQHYPFVLLGAVLLAGKQLLDSPRSSPRAPAWVGYAGYGVAWLMLAGAYLIPSPKLAAISLILLIGSWGLLLCRRIDRPFPVGPWLLLWLVLPPPLALDDQLMRRLQKMSSQLASYSLDLLGVNHLMDGNALVLVDKQLFVDEACSGIISVISIITCAAMYGVWRRRGLIQTLLLMLLAAGWASLLNVVRIDSIALAWVQGEIDWSAGTPHTVLGLVVFVLSLVTLVATDWFLKAALAEIEPRWDQLTGEPIGYGAGLTAIWDRFIAAKSPGTRGGDTYSGWRGLGFSAVSLGLGLLPTLAFAGLGATQLMQTDVAPVMVGEKLDETRFTELLQQDLMPEQIGGLSLTSVEHKTRTSASRFGENSVLYSYRGEKGERYLVSCDYPFHSSWHELSVCYDGIGWRVEDRVVLKGEAATPYDFAQLDLTKPDGRDALVTFTACYSNGDSTVAPTYTLSDRLTQAFTRKQREQVRRQTFQVQVLFESSDGITDQHRHDSQELLGAARAVLIEAARSSLQNANSVSPSSN